jgi:multidrug transporter EmrE-like cation transporter
MKRESYSKEHISNKKVRGKTYYTNLSEKLVKQGKINYEFLDMLSTVDLEEVIALKLELASSRYNNRMYGLPLFSSLFYIVADAVAKFAISTSRTTWQAAAIMGLSLKQWLVFCRMFKIFPRMEMDYVYNKNRPEESDETDEESADIK